MITTQNLEGGYTKSPIIKDLNLEIKKGEFFALLGPNGSGKTTLFKLVTGQLPVLRGEILLEGKDITTLSKLEKARKVAVLTQEAYVSFDYTVEEIVSLGRYPHQKGFLKQLSKVDRKVIEEVMELTNIQHFRKTPFRMISGGEKQRVLLAKALAQEPEILLLDEPTNHLDIKHTFQMLDLLKERQHTMGLTIFAILHDLNVASLFADRIALLHNGSFLEVGDPDILRKTDQLKTVYEVEVKHGSHPTIPKPQLLMSPKYATASHSSSFDKMYQIKQHKECIHIEFNHPLRTISNGHVGNGIQWMKHFGHFYVEECRDYKTDLHRLLTKYSVPHEQAVGIITAISLENTVIHKEEIEGVQMMVVVTAGVDKTSGLPSGSIHTILFIDAHFSDGALVNGYMTATEAKVQAWQDVQTAKGVIGIGASTDSLVLGLTQKGEQRTDLNSETKVKKGIEQMVYDATREAVEKYVRLES